jgi:hypothetical protein
MRVLTNRKELNYSKHNWVINMLDFATNFGFETPKISAF